MKLPGVLLLCALQYSLSAHAANLGLFARADPTPSPISVPPSQNWDGDDGPWSSFTIQAGTPAQDLRVLVSAESDDILLVSSLGCTGSSDSTCSDDRGGLFNPNTSTSWQQHGYYEVNVDQNLGIFTQGNFGNDTVTLGIQGSGGPTLQNQIISAYTSNDMYIGMFGVNPSSTNFTPTDQNRASFLSSLKTGNLIPSLSFGYTAGNQYRLKQVYGSLTLGGYDSSLFTPNNLSIPFAPGPTRQLLVGLQAIKNTNQNGTGATLLENGIMMSVDATVPMIWLPQVVCTHFENAFGLTQDTKTGLYLVSDALHNRLTEQNASVTFTLGATIVGGETVDITLLYASFDLLLKPPAFGVGRSQRYFPLRQAANETQYTLGRTFLQEAYLTVDWERQNFSISACSFAENAKQNLVAITSASSKSSGSGSGSGKTIGIAVGVSVAVVVIGAAIAAFFLIRRRRGRHAGMTGKDREDPSEKVRRGFAKGELDTGHDNQRYEMAGSDPNFHKKAADQDNHGWVDEKANYPGDRSGMVEADGGNSARAELGGPLGASKATGARPLHEMHDPSSQPRFELPADQPGELQGSTPSSSTPASPVSSTRRSVAGRLGGFRSPLSKPSSPLSAPSAASSPHPSPGGRLGASQTPTSAPSQQQQPRSSLLGSLRIGNNRSSAASGSSRGAAAGAPPSSQPSDSDGPMTLPSGRSDAAAHEVFSPVSRRGTFERSGTPSSSSPPGPGEREEGLTSPISPQSPEVSSRQGLWERLRR